MIGICSVDGFMFRVLVEVDKIFWQWISEAHCCATQLPVAPRSRLTGYGAWQHAPGTSHQLTHVVWCQLILRI